MTFGATRYLVTLRSEGPEGKHLNHVIDGLLHTSECIQADTDSQSGKAWVLHLLGNSGQKLGSLSTTLGMHGALLLHKVESLGEKIMGVIGRQNCQGLGACLEDYHGAET